MMGLYGSKSLEAMQVIKQVFDNTWSLYQLESPFFGMTYGDILIGLFVCSITIAIFRKFIGIGVSRGMWHTWKDKEYK